MDLPIPSQLEARRIELKWTQTYLAAKAGYHENTINRVLRGHPTTYRAFLDVANALGFELRLQLTKPQ